MKLVKPTLKYKKSFQNALKEFAEEGRNEGEFQILNCILKQANNMPKARICQKDMFPPQLIGWWIIINLLDEQASGIV